MLLSRLKIGWNLHQVLSQRLLDLVALTPTHILRVATLVLQKELLETPLLFCEVTTVAAIVNKEHLVWICREGSCLSAGS